MQNDLDPKGLEIVRENLLSRVTRPIVGIESRTAQEVFDIMCDRFRHLSATVPAGDGEPVAYINAQGGVLMTEAGREWFKGIRAQIAPVGSPAAPLYASRLSQGTGVKVTDEMVERFAAKLWKLDDDYARSIPHSKIRIALEAALSPNPTGGDDR